MISQFAWMAELNVSAKKIWQEKNHTLILIFVIPISVFIILIREVSIYVNELAFH